MQACQWCPLLGTIYNDQAGICSGTTPYILPYLTEFCSYSRQCIGTYNSIALTYRLLFLFISYESIIFLSL